MSNPHVWVECGHEGCGVTAWRCSDLNHLLHYLIEGRYRERRMDKEEEIAALRTVAKRTRFLTQKLMAHGYGMHAVIGAEIANADEAIVILDAVARRRDR